MMKLSNLVRIYKAVNERFSERFNGSYLVAEHDELHIYLKTYMLFSEEEVEFLEKLGLHPKETEFNDGQVRFFIIYL